MVGRILLQTSLNQHRSRREKHRFSPSRLYIKLVHWYLASIQLNWHQHNAYARERTGRTRLFCLAIFLPSGFYWFDCSIFFFSSIWNNLRWDKGCRVTWLEAFPKSNLQSGTTWVGQKPVIVEIEGLKVTKTKSEKAETKIWNFFFQPSTSSKEA